MIDLIADARAMIASAPDVEQVVYRPHGGSTRAIDAIVDRDPPDSAGQVGASAPLVQVTVVNDATYGIASSEIDTGRDKIEVSDRHGKTATSRPIGRIVEHDAGVLVLEVR